LVVNFADEHSHASRAPAGAHAESGMVGRFGSGGSRSLSDLHHRLMSFEPPARVKEIYALSGFEEPVRQSLLVFFEVIAWASDLQFINQLCTSSSGLPFKLLQVPPTPKPYLFRELTYVDSQRFR
jgi:hypothetical protein